jgi:hypothetical protein
LPGDPGASALTDQKFIVYPADFVGTNYTILDADKGKSLVIINGATAVTITIPVALQLKMQVILYEMKYFNRCCWYDS